MQGQGASWEMQILQAKRDAEWRVAKAEAMGQEDTATKRTLFVHKSWI